MRDLAVIQWANQRPNSGHSPAEGWHVGLADNRAILVGHGRRFEIDLRDDGSLVSMHRESSIPMPVKMRVELLACHWKRSLLYLRHSADSCV